MGQLSPDRVPDTKTYLEFPLTDPVAAAKHIRTYGYPLFLKLDWTADQRITPFLHLAVHCCAVWILFVALRRWGYPTGAAMGIASGILWSLTLMRYGRMITPDCLAHSLGVIAISLLLFLLKEPGRKLWWLSLGLAVLAAYHCRPAYVFLVALVPSLGVLLRWWQSAKIQPAWRELGGLGGRLALMTLVPLLLFAGYRFWMVGHFGLVAFGGYNASGVICQFLQEDDIPKLPEEFRQLATRGLERRELVYAKHGWSTAPTTSYFTIEQRFDESTWRVFVPAAKEIWPDDPIEINRRLSGLARATARLHPKEYATWLVKAAVRGCYLLAAEWILNVFVAVMLPTCIVLYLMRMKLRRTRPSSSQVEPAVDLISLPLIIAVSVASTKLGLVIITSPPLGRFMDPAAVWMPAVLAAIVCQLLISRQNLADWQ